MGHGYVHFAAVFTNVPRMIYSDGCGNGGAPEVLARGRQLARVDRCVVPLEDEDVAVHQLVQHLLHRAAVLRAVDLLQLVRLHLLANRRRHCGVQIAPTQRKRGEATAPICFAWRIKLNYLGGLFPSVYTYK